MLFAEAVLMVFILCISGVHGQANIICAFRGSSVDLPCSAEGPTSSMRWFLVKKFDSSYNHSEIFGDRSHVAYNRNENNSDYTLKIRELRKSDDGIYCCKKNEDRRQCLSNTIRLRVADLQVKVTPTTEGQTVTLTCSTSCSLTEEPAAYIWYKNGEFLYEDWSPWYQELVSSDAAVTYSCAVKGYEHLSAPEVSVDSVTPNCFRITHKDRRTNSSQQTSTITYPREVHVHWNSLSPRQMICNHSCPEAGPKTAYRWYRNRQLRKDVTTQQLSNPGLNESHSCAVKGLEHLASPEVCAANKCDSVNYVRRRVCALEGSSVNISSNYTLLRHTTEKYWFKRKRGVRGSGEKLEASDRVVYKDNGNHHILTIKNLTGNDSAEYTFNLQVNPTLKKVLDLPAVTLTVTGLKVHLFPENVANGQRVTLTCMTSCPLPANTTYIWYLNGQRLKLQQGENKHIVLDAVKCKHAGNYTCAVDNRRFSNSSEKTLTAPYDREGDLVTASVAVGAAVLVIVLLIVFFCIRRKRSSSQSSTAEATENTEQLNLGSVCESTSAQPAEEAEFHYSRINFSPTKADQLYATVQPHRPKKDDLTTYAVVNFRPNTSK